MQSDLWCDVWRHDQIAKVKVDECLEPLGLDVKEAADCC